METMNISLPPAMKQFIEEQVAAGGYHTVSAYIRRLVREEQKRMSHDAIDHQLLEVLDADSTTPWTSADSEALKRRVRERHPHLQDEP